MKEILASFAVLAILLGAGCAGPKEPPPRSIKVLDDTVITAVKMNLKTDPVLASSKIDVAAENSLLVLRGTVPNEESKKKAEELARKVSKVENVANHLEVSEVEE